MGIQVGQLVIKSNQPKEEVERSVSGIKRATDSTPRAVNQEREQAAAARRQSQPVTKMATRTKRNDSTDEEPVVVINGVAKKFHKRSPYMLDMLTTDE